MTDAATPAQPRTAAGRALHDSQHHTAPRHGFHRKADEKCSLRDAILAIEAEARPAVASEGLRALITDESRYNLTDYGRGWNDAIRAALELDVPLVTDEELSTSVGWGALASAPVASEGLRAAAKATVDAFGEYWNDDKGALALTHAVIALDASLAAPAPPAGLTIAEIQAILDEAQA